MIIRTTIKSTTLSSHPPRTTAMVVDGADFAVNSTSAAVIRTKPPPIAAPMTNPQIQGRPRTPPQIDRDKTVIMASAMEHSRGWRGRGSHGSAKLLVMAPQPFKDSLTHGHSTTDVRKI